MATLPITPLSLPEMLTVPELQLKIYSNHLIKQGKCSYHEHHYYVVLGGGSHS